MNKLLLWVRQETTRLDRRSRLLHWLLSLALFGGIAYFVRNSLQSDAVFLKIAWLVEAAVYVWVLSYAWQHSRLRREPAPEGSVAAHVERLVARYDRKIQLLKRVRLWYILPVWASFMLLLAAYFLDPSGNPDRMGSLGLMAAIFTAALALIAWMIHVGPVRGLERKRTELLELAGRSEP